MRRVVALTLVLLLACVPLAAARVVTNKNVKSPTGLINCLALIKLEGGGIECSAPYLPGGEGLDPYFDLHQHGTVRNGGRGDYPGYSGVKTVTLHYGDTWKRPGIRCSLATSGLTCHNLDGHGFHIAKGAVRRF